MRLALAVLALLSVALGAALVIRWSSPRLQGAGPRLISNQTAYPITLYGRGFRAGMKVHVTNGTHDQLLETAFIDRKHLSTVIPADSSLPADTFETVLSLTLLSPQGRRVRGLERITVINDAGYPNPTAMAASATGQSIFVLSPTTDELWVLYRDGTSPPETVQVGDGPRALVLLPASNTSSSHGGDGNGRARPERLAICHQWSPEIWLIDVDELSSLRHAPPRVQRLPYHSHCRAMVASRDGTRLYVTNQLSDTLDTIDLGTGAIVGSAAAGINPDSVALDADEKHAIVANLASGDISIFALPTATLAAPVAPAGSTVKSQPTAETAIIGGRTSRYQRYVMGGKAPRALAVSQSTGKAFVASVGPNIGPNPDRMEVSINGGVGVVDLETGRFERHVALTPQGGGVPQALVLDEARGALFVADVSRGRIVSFDANKLSESDASAQDSRLGSLALPLPDGIETFRPRADFGVDGRAGIEVHSGPQALALVDGGATLLVLSRYSGTVTEVDVRDAAAMRPISIHHPPSPSMWAQSERRRGEMVYFTDLGRSGMSCDSCHIEGHNDGVLFEKTHPLHIYRVTSLRGSRETPPYFFPSQLPSLSVTALQVLDRNRFGNPAPTRFEARDLTTYQAGITNLPNPYVRSDGSPPYALTLPDGQNGNAVRGLALFEGRAGCASSSCHAAPLFTADQSAATRGHVESVGTPISLPLRTELQEVPQTGLPVPSLIQLWDNWPLLESGAGGFEVTADGMLEPRYPFAARRVLDDAAATGRHGNVAALTAEERNDLLAYLLTL